MSVTIRELLEASCHFGHQTRFWNPQMSPYIYGERNKIHIINLEKTKRLFCQALDFSRNISKNHGKVLFVGTKRAASSVIAEEAQRAAMPYVDHRWLGGMLTNFKTVKRSIKRLQDMEKEIEDGLFLRLSKKDALLYQRKVDKLRRSLGGIASMHALPDAVFIIDVEYQKIAVAESNKLGIPVIGVVDTNSSPAGIDYVVPGNDDSQKAIRLYARCVTDAILLGRSQAVQELKEMVETKPTDIQEEETSSLASDDESIA